MWHRLGATLLPLLLACATACEDRSSGTSATVVTVRNNDADMAAAMDRARQTLPQFIAAVQLPRPSQTDFTIKVGFTDRQDTEYMWVAPVTYDGKKFHGTLNNEPVQVRNVKLGDKVSIDPSRVADWRYVEAGKLVGGYTLRLLRDRMTPEQRARYDASRTFKIE